MGQANTVTKAASLSWTHYGCPFRAPRACLCPL